MWQDDQLQDMISKVPIMSVVPKEFKEQFLRWRGLIEKIETYLRSKDKVMKAIHIDGANFEGYQKMIEVVTEMQETTDIEPIIVCVTAFASDERAFELIRWPFYGIELVVDDRLSGNIGATGSNKNIRIVKSLLHL
jgi:hypothetical protein